MQRYLKLRPPFWNERENRLRALWRVLGAVVIVIALTTIFDFFVVRPLDLPLAVLTLLSNGFAALVTIVLLVGWARYVDRRALRRYGFRLDRRWWGMLVAGGLVGLIGWGGALATNLTLDWASISAYFSRGDSGLPFVISFASFALGWVFVGFWEEVVFRGIVMRNAIEGLTFSSVSYRTSLLGGWILSSVFFGLLHLNQARSPVAIGFWILAGLVLGLAYLLTDQLALPIGLHAGFDLGVNNVFGLASVRDAGLRAPTIVRPTFTGPDGFVGLSGIVNTAWLLVIGLLALVVVRWTVGPLRPRIESDSPGGD